MPRKLSNNSPTPITAARDNQPSEQTVNDLSDAEFRAPGEGDPCVVIRIDPATQRMAVRWYGMDADAAALNLLGVGAELAKGRIIENAQRLNGVVSSLVTQAQ